MIRVSFIPNAAQVIKEVRGEIANELKGFSNELFKQLKAETPKAGGRARRGWNQRKSLNKVRLTNRVPYIERLEDNYSRQTQGAGIIKPAIRKTKANRQRRTR
jgi:hypothetical protein